MVLKDYHATEHFQDTHASAFGAGRLNPVRKNQNNLASVANNKLSEVKKGGFYKDEYLRDSLEHWTDPAYALIKPNYRDSKPRPALGQLRVKN